MLIDPEGYAVAMYSGEGNRERMDRDIQLLLQTYPDVAKQQPFHVSMESAPAMPLCYPGKVLADAAHGRLFIADSNHNQIIVCTLDGAVLARIGSGVIGAADGDYRTATFNHPQGMALVGETLYVADTENHLLRAVDLAAQRVTTIAGTGAQARFRATGGDALTTAINSPWDLAYVNDELYIAMAGPHQIWVYCPSARRVDVFAGSGAEARVDGTLDDAAFAQPSGIATDGANLYIADSETSSIRRIDLVTGRVTTLAGEDLFAFGDVDGSGATVRLQHPLGVAYADGALLIADTYNHKSQAARPRHANRHDHRGGGRTLRTGWPQRFRRRPVHRGHEQSLAPPPRPDDRCAGDDPRARSDDSGTGRVLPRARNDPGIRANPHGADARHACRLAHPAAGAPHQHRCAKQPIAPRGWRAIATARAVTLGRHNQCFTRPAFRRSARGALYRHTLLLPRR